MSEPIEKDEKTQLKSFKDIKNVDDLDFNEIELVRGETPKDINERCLELCQNYLSGNWCQQTTDTIEVRRVTGGLMNQIYYCGIKQGDNSEKVPQEVAVRFYGNNFLATLETSRIRDYVNSLIFSEKNLGPKIYGLFEEGQIIKYYQHRQFKLEEQKNPKITEQVFKTLAKIHSLNVPIKKNPNWLSGLIENFLEVAFEKFQIHKEMDEFKCYQMKKFDFKVETDWMIGVAESVESPVVFCHNDFRSSNIMVTEPNDELVVCDYDISGYGYRGYDFVILSRDWGRIQFDKTPVLGIPFKDEEFKTLIEIYVEECQRIHGKSYSQNPINSVDHILKEVKVFSLFFELFGIVFLINNDENGDGLPICRKELAEKGVNNYISIKNALKEQMIIE